MGVIAAPNLTPIFQHPCTTPLESTELKLLTLFSNICKFIQARNGNYTCQDNFFLVVIFTITI